MTLRMICDACEKKIDDDAEYRELVLSEDRQRHYHLLICWPAVRQGVRDAEQTVRETPAP